MSCRVIYLFQRFIKNKEIHTLIIVIKKVKRQYPRHIPQRFFSFSLNRFTRISSTTSDRTKTNDIGKIAIEMLAKPNKERNISLIENATRNENNILK